MELIDGVIIKELKTILDERGYLQECFRSDWPQYKKFGQSYITVAFPNVVKAWHCHKIQTDNIVCIYGNAKLVLYDGREVRGRLVRMDRKRDLALVHIDLKLDTFISLPQGRNLLGMGEKLYSVGCPINLRGSVYSGTINAPPRRLNGLPLWQIEMKIYPGSSGSPVFDVQGTLVAIVKGRYRGTDSIGFLIPLETIMEFLQETSTQ